MSTDGPDAALGQALLESLDGLLAALALEPLGHDRYRMVGEPGRFDRVFGGQLLAQALVAAGATVPGKAPHSMHAYFVATGSPGEALEVVVDRVRDGRSFATRRVSVLQGDRELLTATASFHDNPPGAELGSLPPEGPPPTELPLLQTWAAAAPTEFLPGTMRWVEMPPPLEMRLAEPPTFFGGPVGEGNRSHWLRLPRDVGEDPVLNAALLAYASDYFLLDMAFRSHPDGPAPGSLGGVSLDHSIWFHRPVRFGGWHVYTQESLALSGHRGLVKGTIHEADGHLVATVVQETLVRPTR